MSDVKEKSKVISTPKDHTKLECKILKCTCDHEFQDSKYGKKMRVFNPGKSAYHCTVCGARD